MALTLLLGGFAAFMTIGLPVAICFIAASIVYLWYVDTSLMMVTQLLAGGVRNYTLIAVPLYILAGELMNSGGITNRIFSFARAAVGHIRGGLGHVNVFASVIFAGMSGSSSADAAGLGRVEIKAMRDQGYRPAFAAAITAASSSIGPIIPPSIHLVIFGAIAEVGVDHLFLAGIVPGLIMALCLSVAIYVLGATGIEHCPVERWPGLRAVGRAFWTAILPLSAPVIIVGGILSGVFTPTEAGATAVAYALLLGLVFGDLGWREINEALVRSVKSTAVVMFILAAAKVFSWGITVERVPDLLAAGLLSLSADPHVMLALILVGLLVIGTFESASANLVIITPMLLPLAPLLGLDVVHLGIIVVLGLMIGIVTPPVGISLFIVAEIAELPFGDVVRAVLPYVLALIVSLVIVAYSPELVLWIPEWFGYRP